MRNFKNNYKRRYKNNHDRPFKNNGSNNRVNAEFSISNDFRRKKTTRNNLNALSARLGISGYDRTYHGALLDAQILADTYLNLTGGQVTFDLSESQIEESKDEIDNKYEDVNFLKFNAKDEDLSEHKKFLEILSKKTDKEISW